MSFLKGLWEQYVYLELERELNDDYCSTENL